MDDNREIIRAKCLCLDIETSRQDRLKLREIGVYRPDTGVRLRLSSKLPDLVPKLNQVSEGATFLLGHNIVAFDQPALALLHPDLTLHQLPMVDTLELSPIAFPQNPYHRLVKDYKLYTTVKNNPVRDAELAYELFLDQREALLQRVAEHPDEALCLHFLLTSENGKGVANFFATLRAALRPALADVQHAWLRTTENKVCRVGQQRVLTEFLPQLEWHKPLAYVLVWLRVSGGNSVLPPWVSLTFPKTRELISLLRDRPCNGTDCQWCQEQHNLAKLLPHYFPGMTQFRPTPTTKHGGSLQQAIVENGFAGTSSLAILPTGGGKSLCYQLPALARFYRNGSLTVIISPLQSLMKDQVDNLESRGITCAGFLNSLLNPIERRAMLDKLRLGDLGLIFIAPEQFRSTAFTNALSHREIAAWVFDEAHCLSKWGHDFRPDYLYVSRFIKLRQKDSPSPIFCFTATAKPDVVQDIVEHFKNRLGLELAIMEGGVKRENLLYEVYAVPAQAKYPEVLRLLEEALKDNGGAIVFCARQKTVEEMADFLKQAGLECGFFHGGMLPEEKRRVQEAFIHGELRVIAATNAFGMGVDKADVRLVIHLDTPGSLENYLQEAGRAGRDQEPARCVLLFDDADLDVQFRLLRNSKLTQQDIQSILKALRTIEKKDRSEGALVVTSGEILLEISDKHGIDPDAQDADTKVRIAVAWLEEARLLERQENHVRVYPGSLLVANLDEAITLLRKKLGANANIEPYVALLSMLFNCADDEGVSTDDLVVATGNNTQHVIKMLKELDRFKLLSDDTEIGVTLFREPDTAERLDALRILENSLIACLRETAPDADQDDWQPLNIRILCDTLRRDSGKDLNPEHLSRLLKSFAEAFGNDNGHRGFFALRPGGQDTRYVKFLRSWQQIEVIRQKRLVFAQALINFFLNHRQGNNLLVTCKQSELETALQSDLTLIQLDINDWNVALSAALIYLDTNEVLHLARGKAIFRSAMNIELNGEARRRQFNKSDYAELALHYKDKIIQVHVMAEYARLGLAKIQAAMAFIFDYFGMDRDEFVRRYFAGRQEILEIATTETSHRRILTELKNPAQQAIVAANMEGNHLVLAGPGSGKTKIIVHRVAWLLRERNVSPESIMVLSYNRSAAIQIRKRLWDLVGVDAASVTVQTLHSLAMRLTGTSYAVAVEHGENIEFSAVIKKAIAYLKNAEANEDIGVSIQRDRLLSGLRYLLVDEYQDVNGEHYELISALTGRALNSDDEKLWLLAVGDDDQNIYEFGGANVRYIKQFSSDYKAQTHYLIENYRSTKHIIQCSNRVIAPMRNRMKTEHVLSINYARKDLPTGGEWESKDSLTQGRVHILETPANVYAEITIALSELQRLNQLATNGQSGHWGKFAVIARQWVALEPMADLCRQSGIPVRMLRDDYLLDLHCTREGHSLLSLLKKGAQTRRKKRLLLRWGVLSRWFRRRYHLDTQDLIAHPYRALLAQFIHERESVAPGSTQVVSDVIEALYEFRSGSQITHDNNLHAPLLLLTAHRAKGLEFDHVVILDAGGWPHASDDERRLYYVAMTRARKTLTLCAQHGFKHAFIRECEALCLKTQPIPPSEVQTFKARNWIANPRHVKLSWPGFFSSDKVIHRAIAALELGSELLLRNQQDVDHGWELADKHGTTVARMAQAFLPPPGQILAVKVAVVMVRFKKKSDTELLKKDSWEVVIPEIKFLPD